MTVLTPEDVEFARTYDFRGLLPTPPDGAVTEPCCPFNGGSHKFLVTSWGRSCRFCHQTWEWRGKVLVATWA